MHLKTILPTYEERKRTPRITFYKDGYLGISNEAQLRFNFKEGNRISILQDSSDHQKLYIQIYNGSGNFPLLRKSKNGMLKCGYTSAHRVIAECFPTGRSMSYAFEIGPCMLSGYGLIYPLKYMRKEVSNDS